TLGTKPSLNSTARTGKRARLDSASLKRMMSINPALAMVPSANVPDRVAAIDWEQVSRDLDAEGHAIINRVLSSDEAESISSLYKNDDLFRSRVVMERHRFGRGEYKYFKYPLPEVVASLRTAVYPHLAPVANRWNEALRLEARYPAEHADYIEHCHQAGQYKPTPLMLQYQAGDYNCLHQDLYGEHVFPLQLAILLSEPERDFTGGEFVLTEQRPRMQSRPIVVPLKQGDAVVFAVQHRPVQGAKSVYRVNLRHGVSRVRSGHRHTLGIIFHDAR
ncbi:MAG TPA: 2OG-Fe(II) oxygenase, partial [Pyrinomonadaceae bacterium]|nr:2OG-Fe(II) oxygenase [Pyrinomonadaceae bacterium]